MRFGRETTAYTQGESGLRTSVESAGDRRQADVVDLRIGAPDAAAGNRDFELAREIVKFGVARELLRRRERQRRCVADFVSIDASNRASGDVARDVAARAHGIQTALPQRLENLRKRFDGYPVELDVLPHREIGNAASMTLSQVSDGPQLRRIQNAVGDAYAKHEARQCFALATFSADHAGTVSLRVHAPPAKIGAEPFGWNGIKSGSREASNLVEGLPRIFLPLQALNALRLRFFNRFGLCHKKEKPTASFLLAVGWISAGTKKSLSQQPPGARRHDCATTSTTAHAVETLLVLVGHLCRRF